MYTNSSVHIKNEWPSFNINSKNKRGSSSTDHHTFQKCRQNQLPKKKNVIQLNVVMMMFLSRCSIYYYHHASFLSLLIVLTTFQAHSFTPISSYADPCHVKVAENHFQCDSYRNTRNDANIHVLQSHTKTTGGERNVKRNKDIPTLTKCVENSPNKYVNAKNVQSENGTSVKSNHPKKKRKKNTTQKQKNGKHPKQELNNLIKSMGLKPVEAEIPTAATKTNHKNPIELLQSTKTIPLKIQLQYARNGHAALRSILPKSIIQSMKQELVQYSKSKELDAWKQKVEVATKSVSIAKKCTSIAQCKTILLQEQQKQTSNDNNDDPNSPHQLLSIPFLQHFNTWQSKSSNPTIHTLVTSPFLPNLASQLLDVPSVRLYQDSLFHKRFKDKDGPTPWHSDARMAPFDTSNMITFWIPLDYIPKEEEGGTGLLFVDKSHGDFALPFWNPVPKCDADDNNVNNDDVDGRSSDINNDENEDDVYSRLDERYGGEESITHYMPMELGDCTVHAGWTLHCANGMMILDGHDSSNSSNNKNQKDRYALAVTYVDAKAEIRRDIQQNSYTSNDGTTTTSTASSTMDRGHHEDRQSFRKWVDEVPARTQYFEHPLVPIVWSR